jgi:hypothetical protein
LSDEIKQEGKKEESKENEEEKVLPHNLVARNKIRPKFSTSF